MPSCRVAIDAGGHYVSGMPVWRTRHVKRSIWFRLALVAALAAPLLPGSVPAANAQDFTKGGVTVSTPWARATPGGATVAGAFLGIKAAAGADDKLVAARSTVAGSVELHDHINDGGVMKMRRVDGIAIKGGDTVTLKPGGLHLMLMDLKAPLMAGDKVEVTLVFEKAGEVAVTAQIAPVGAAGPSEMGSGSGSGSAK